MRRFSIAIMSGFALLAGVAAANAESIGNCPVTEYGNGVFYLKCSDAGRALAELRGKYPDSILTFTYYERVVTQNTAAQGYYVMINPMPNNVKK